MRTLLWVVLVFDQLFLLFVGATDLSRYDITDFQSKQLYGGKTDKRSRELRQLHKQLSYVKRQQQLELLVAFAVGVALFTHLIDPPAVGLLWALLTLLVIVVSTRLNPVQRLGHQLFEYLLGIVLKVSKSFKPLWLLVGLSKKPTASIATSKPELIEQVESLPSSLVTASEKQRLVLGLQADEKTVKDIMTVKKKVVIIDPSATLGPVLLSDLQKSGHGYFPVAAKSGQPEGILTLSDIGDLQMAKQHSQVKDLMSEQIAWVEEFTSLDELAEAFIAEKQYLILVRNLNGEFSGVVTISDLLKHTLGIITK